MRCVDTTCRHCYNSQFLSSICSGLSHFRFEREDALMQVRYIKKSFINVYELKVQASIPLNHIWDELELKARPHV